MIWCTFLNKFDMAEGLYVRILKAVNACGDNPMGHLFHSGGLGLNRENTTVAEYHFDVKSSMTTGSGRGPYSACNYTLAFASQTSNFTQQMNVPETNHSVNLAGLPSSYFYDLKRPFAQVPSKLPHYRTPPWQVTFNENSVTLSAKNGTSKYLSLPH
jgi:hypothetical protein